jgi:uncharacterized protein
MNLLQPDVILGGSVLALTPSLLQRHGVRGMILDVDDTIVSIVSPSPSLELREWLQEMRALCQVWLVSNNPHRHRIEPIATTLQLPYLLQAAKPSGKKLRQAVAAMELPPAQIAMVGDRIFTDVLGGNRLGLLTVLVQPISTSSHGFQALRRTEFALARWAGVSLAPSNG